MEQRDERQGQASLEGIRRLEAAKKAKCRSAARLVCEQEPFLAFTPFGDGFGPGKLLPALWASKKLKDDPGWAGRLMESIGDPGLVEIASRNLALCVGSRLRKKALPAVLASRLFPEKSNEVLEQRRRKAVKRMASSAPAGVMAQAFCEGARKALEELAAQPWGFPGAGGDVLALGKMAQEAVALSSRRELKKAAQGQPEGPAGRGLKGRL